MFTPIIHNLQPGDLGYNETQAFNALIAKRPKDTGSLSSKVIKIAGWKLECQAAYEAVKQAVGA